MEPHGKSPLLCVFFLSSSSGLSGIIAAARLLYAYTQHSALPPPAGRPAAPPAIRRSPIHPCSPRQRRPRVLCRSHPAGAAGVCFFPFWPPLCWRAAFYTGTTPLCRPPGSTPRSRICPPASTGAASWSSATCTAPNSARATPTSLPPWRRRSRITSSIWGTCRTSTGAPRPAIRRRWPTGSPPSPPPTMSPATTSGPSARCRS